MRSLPAAGAAGFGAGATSPFAHEPKFFSTRSNASLAVMSPTIAIVALFGTYWALWKATMSSRVIAPTVSGVPEIGCA